MAFLKERARANFFDVYVHWDRLYFQLPAPQLEAHVLEWGKNLSSFTPRISSAGAGGRRRSSAATTRSWPRRSSASRPRRTRPENLVERLGSDVVDTLVTLGRTRSRPRGARARSRRRHVHPAPRGRGVRRRAPARAYSRVCTKAPARASAFPTSGRARWSRSKGSGSGSAASTGSAHDAHPRRQRLPNVVRGHAACGLEPARPVAEDAHGGAAAQPRAPDVRATPRQGAQEHGRRAASVA